MTASQKYSMAIAVGSFCGVAGIIFGSYRMRDRAVTAENVVRELSAKPDPQPDVIVREPMSRLVAAIAQVESGGWAMAHNKSEDAVGILQIRPIMVREVNRILGSETFTLRDRWSPERSQDIFRIYVEHWARRHPTIVANLGFEEHAARIWNGGPEGCSKESTNEYWRRVKAAMKTMENE